MNEPMNTIMAERRPVINFCMLSPEGLQHTAAELGLSLSLTALLRCREYFRLRELRDPTVGELRFLDALTSLRATLPAATLIDGVCGSDEDRRIFADILRQGEALMQDGESMALHVNGLQSMSGRYLARCGAVPYHKSLKCGHVAEFSALGLGQAKGPTLTLGSVMAAQMTEEKAPRSTPYLLLLFPTGQAPFEREVAAFFDAHQALGLTPLAVPHGEGVFPHLLALETGVSIDTAGLLYFNPDEGLSALASYGKGTVLFTAPQHALPLLLGKGAPITLLGQRTPGIKRLVLHHGNTLLLTAETGLLHALLAPCHVRSAVTARIERLLAIDKAEDGTTLLMGMTTEKGCADTLLRTVGQLVAAGGDPKRMTATALLELPPMSATVLSEALACLLDLHRITCELAIPSCHHRQITRPGLTTPRLTVFLAAERREPREEEFAATWASAISTKAYDQMRAILYPTN